MIDMDKIRERIATAEDLLTRSSGAEAKRLRSQIAEQRSNLDLFEGIIKRKAQRDKKRPASHIALFGQLVPLPASEGAFFRGKQAA